ncbi:MAG TPA: MgtC/SapB family protein [Polyangiaceae bacterium]
MQPTPSLFDIVLRLVLTAVTAGIMGADRAERGRAAGLRTTMLVGLAAAVAMLQADLLLPVRGKEADSFAVLDLMRLPLGILSGMGFIGAAAVLRKDDVVIGVTTAATLWFVSVLGLCFGGGQLLLGSIAFALGWAVLSGVKRIENRLKEERRGSLELAVTAEGPRDEVLRDRLRSAGLATSRWSVVRSQQRPERIVRCDVRWKALRKDSAPPPLLDELAIMPGIREVVWQAA